MKKHISLPALVGSIVMGVLPVMLTGCSKPASEAPATGYAGGQKGGAVNNAPSSAGGSVGTNRAGAVNNAPSSSGQTSSSSGQ